jgi:hypothetical protein
MGPARRVAAQTYLLPRNTSDRNWPVFWGSEGAEDDSATLVKMP